MNTNIPKTRKKVNFKNYKEVCKALKEQEYKRGSKEKKAQIKRWETNLHIHKKKDNSFTHINEEFKTKKQLNKIETMKKKEEKLNMLKIKISQIKNVVLMEILNQNKTTSNDINKQFVASNGFIIETQTSQFKIFNEGKIYIPNNILSLNNKITCYDFDSEETAINFIKEAGIAVKEYNNNNKKRKKSKNVFIIQ